MKWKNKMDSEVRNIDLISKYICTVGYPLIFLEISVSTILLISLALAFNYNRLNMVFAVTAVITIIMFIATYIIMKSIKSKQHRLNIKRLTVLRKIVTIIILIVFSLIVTYTYAMIYVWLMSDSIIGM